MTDAFWAMVDAQLDELEASKPDTADGVIAIMNRHHAPSSGDAFFPGGGGDRDLASALYPGGWRVDRYNAHYYYTVKHQTTGEVLTYTEGDVSKGDHLIPDGANFKVADLSGEDERTVWIAAETITDLLDQVAELELGYDLEDEVGITYGREVYEAYRRVMGEEIPGNVDELRELVERAQDCYEGEYISDAAYAEETWSEDHSDLLRDDTPDWYSWIDWEVAWNATYRHGTSEHDGHYFRDM